MKSYPDTSASGQEIQNCNSAQLSKMTEEEALFWSQDLSYWGAFACLFSQQVGHLQTFLLARGQAFANPGAIPEFLTCTVSFQNITTQTKSRLGHLSRTGGLSRHVNQGSKLKKSSSRLLTTNCRNIVARCKFLVGSLYNVNDTAH